MRLRLSSGSKKKPEGAYRARLAQTKSDCFELGFLTGDLLRRLDIATDAIRRKDKADAIGSLEIAATAAEEAMKFAPRAQESLLEVVKGSRNARSALEGRRSPFRLAKPKAEEAIEAAERSARIIRNLCRGK